MTQHNTQTFPSFHLISKSPYSFTNVALIAKFTNTQATKVYTGEHYNPMDVSIIYTFDLKDYLFNKYS